VLHFEGSDSINDAERLRGLELQVPFSERFVIPRGRHYISDLVGCEVWEVGAREPLGVVREVQGAGGAAESWLLAVGRSNGHGEVLIPLAEEICTLIDTSARRIEVRLPDGLLELNS
jgi:16S rRNA processing protein RimM